MLAIPIITQVPIDINKEGLYMTKKCHFNFSIDSDLKKTLRITALYVYFFTPRFTLAYLVIRHP